MIDVHAPPPAPFPKRFLPKNHPLQFTADLVVDTYLDEVVRSLEQQGLTNEADEVEIHQDGHWEPILEDQKVGAARCEQICRYKSGRLGWL